MGNHSEKLGTIIFGLKQTSKQAKKHLYKVLKTNTQTKSSTSYIRHGPVSSHFSHVSFFAILGTMACWAPLSMGLLYLLTH